MAKYAERTEVPAAKTRMDIEKILQKYGATGFLCGWLDDGTAGVMFQMNNRHIRFTLKMPPQDAKAVEQQVRQKWRALFLVIKAKLEAVESEIEEFDEAFLGQIVLPDKATVFQHMGQQLELTYERGDMPPLLTSMIQ